MAPDIMADMVNAECVHISLPFVGHVGGIPVLFCSLAVLDPRVGHTMDVLSPFIPVLCHSD